MQRRRFLKLSTAAGITSSTGCLSTAGLSNDSTSTPTLGISDSEKVDLYESVTYNSVQIEASQTYFEDAVKYNNPDEGKMKTWDPGEDRIIVIVHYSAENLSREDKSFPYWRNFTLLTPDGKVNPTDEAPDGTTAREVEKTLYWSRVDGVSANSSKGWSGVYNAPSYDKQNVAIQWNRPDGEIVYWGW